MEVNVNLGSKIKSAIEENKPTLNYIGDIITAGALMFCVGYVKCISDIIKHQPK